MANRTFLYERTPREVALPDGLGLSAGELYIGPGNQGLEIVVAQATSKPTARALQDAWRQRRKGRAIPLVLVALYRSANGETKATLCGPTGEEPPAHFDIDPGQVARLCGSALDQPDRHAALNFLAQALPSLDTQLPGVRNEGLLALHALAEGAPKRLDWANATTKSRTAVGKQGMEMLSALGFKAERLDNLTQILRTGDKRTALAVLLDRSEIPEAGSNRFNTLSPVTYALNKADAENLPWVIMLQGDRLRLYATGVGVGVGRRGRTETYIECQPALLAEKHLGYLWLLFSADALKTNGAVNELLDQSRRFAGDLAHRLRERIYVEVVPRLATGIAEAMRGHSKKTPDLDLVYRTALVALFRLLFIAYAEDCDLLPYRHNDAYRRRSLKQKAQELADAEAKKLPIAGGDEHWREVAALWRAISTGNKEWAVPAYNGTLFSQEKAVSVAGAALAGISLPNSVFELALKGLLLIETPEGPLGPVDFRALGVREFGTIYEGLLESELSEAETDLTLDKGGAFVPVKGKQIAFVRAGEVYLHDRSGARKASGSYFTKSFAVEHLLDGALEPALSDHLARLDGFGEADAAEAFFDFRVADIAMGSGHFLVAAIDRIEKRLAEYLGRRPLPGVRKVLADLRTAALNELGDLAEQMTLEDSQLLRRLIARRCIYGVDLNELSVQLARLSIWIHSFVPGLPLSLLDHNLVRGNALVGVGTIQEIHDAFAESGLSLFPVDAGSLLGMARKPLERLARLADTTVKDIEKGREAMEEARLQLLPTSALCDILTARPVCEEARKFQLDRWETTRITVHASNTLREARQVLAGLHPFHFPIAFPEVFLRRRAGFDVILGNPPWQEATVEEHAFWARHSPGLRGLDQREQEQAKARLRRARPDLVAQYETEVAEANSFRALLTSGSYPGMGTGDPDTYKAFCWRFWNLLPSDGGRLGVVLPRNALAAKGSTEFRLALFKGSKSISVTMLLNNKHWVFSEVHPQYSFALLTVRRGEPDAQNLALRGPYPNHEAFCVGVAKPPAMFAGVDVLDWNDTASLPLLPTEGSGGVFAQLRKSPRLDLNDGKSWRARPDGELHATAQKPLMNLKAETCPEGFWPVYKGESFDIWNPDTGRYYAFANPKKVLPWLQKKRLKAAKSRKDSAHGEFKPAFLRDEETLPCMRPRVAFRDVTNRTNQRTVIAALVPGSVFITNKGPYFLWPRGDEKDQAFLLGVLCSLSLDWYARRFVEINMNFFILNPFPIPRPPRADPRWKRIVEVAGRLACPDKRFAQWAKAVGVKHGALNADEKEDMIHELDAVVAHLYGLSESQLVQIFETFHEGWDYAARLGATLKHFHAWAKRGA